MRGGVAGPTSIEQALERLEQAHESLLGGLGNISQDLFHFTSTVRDAVDETSLAGGLSGAPATGGLHTGATHHGSTPWGVKASQGSRPNMEDAYSVQVPSAASHGGHRPDQQHPHEHQQRASTAGERTSAASSSAASAEAASSSSCLLAGPTASASSPAPGVNPQQQQHTHQQLASPEAEDGVASHQAPICAPPIPEDLAVLSVFDGHGGTEVAEHCRDRLHMHFAAALSAQQCGPAARGVGETPHECCEPHPLPSSTHSPSHVSEALRMAFDKIDHELAGTEAGEYVGATAVVAVVGRHHIWIAHCGDSRAVIQRSGEAEALTRDHKPDREDEAARIKAAGGRIVYTSGSHRVMGMLAMSRAIGDHFLRPYVTAEPEVACVERTVHDEVLVLATDGLWDVFSCKEATTLAQRCITRSKERGMSRHGACRVAASVLTKVAIERGSRDNITVIVVDVSMAPQPSTATLTSQLISTPPPTTASTTTSTASTTSTMGSAATSVDHTSTTLHQQADSGGGTVAQAGQDKPPPQQQHAGTKQGAEPAPAALVGSLPSVLGQGGTGTTPTKAPLLPLRAHASETDVVRPPLESPQPVASGVAMLQQPQPQAPRGQGLGASAAPLPPLPLSTAHQAGSSSSPDTSSSSSSTAAAVSARQQQAQAASGDVSARVASAAGADDSNSSPSSSAGPSGTQTLASSSAGSTSSTTTAAAASSPSPHDDGWSSRFLAAPGAQAAPATTAKQQQQQQLQQQATSPAGQTASSEPMSSGSPPIASTVGMASGGSTGVKQMLTGQGMGARTQSFSVTSCTWVKGGTAAPSTSGSGAGGGAVSTMLSSSEASLAQAGAPTAAAAAVGPGDRGLAVQPSVPSSNGGHRASGTGTAHGSCTGTQPRNSVVPGPDASLPVPGQQEDVSTSATQALLSHSSPELHGLGGGAVTPPPVMAAAQHTQQCTPSPVSPTCSGSAAVLPPQHRLATQGQVPARDGIRQPASVAMSLPLDAGGGGGATTPGGASRAGGGGLVLGTRHASETGVALTLLPALSPSCATRLGSSSSLMSPVASGSLLHLPVAAGSNTSGGMGGKSSRQHVAVTVKWGASGSTAAATSATVPAAAGSAAGGSKGGPSLSAPSGSHVGAAAGPASAAPVMHLTAAAGERQAHEAAKPSSSSSSSASAALATSRLVQAVLTSSTAEGEHVGVIKAAPSAGSKWTGAGYKTL